MTCHWCKDQGIFLARRRGAKPWEADACFRCNKCDGAQRQKISPDVPYWHSSLEDAFEPQNGQREQRTAH